MNSTAQTRRSFLLGLTALAAHAARAQTPSNKPKILTFSKPFQNVGFEKTADVLKEAGFDGLECPVRPKGQILPERVEEDLPKLVDALRSRGLTLGIVTTDITTPTPLAEKVLRTAKALGTTLYRTGYLFYDLNNPIAPQLARFKSQLAELAALNRQIGIQGGLQNHSGSQFFGAPVWDLREALEGVSPTELGILFDIGHATVEGGMSWPLEARLAQPHLAGVYVKDFHWGEKGNSRKPVWGPLGTGKIQPEFFKWLVATGFQGPISLHCEYLAGASREDVQQMRKDLATLRAWI
ncbi:MAG: hypothetical protein RLZZ253_3040 [Verrucomicrobiota bacterium]